MSGFKVFQDCECMKCEAALTILQTFEIRSFFQPFLSVLSSVPSQKYFRLVIWASLQYLQTPPPLLFLTTPVKMRILFKGV